MQNNNYNTNNKNAQQKEKGLNVGSQFRVWDIKTGQKSNGDLWGMLTHTEKDKNKNVLQKYTIWLNNDSNFIANFPLQQTVDLKIESIVGVKPETKSYTKNGQKVVERIINLTASVSIVNVFGNNNNNTNNDININDTNFFIDNNNTLEENNNENLAIDDIDFLL